ncbi:DUF2178 domain-containing protein [Halobaculum sp. EA56]|uniref:DUF2178 domain-containing protein n=1 Tax=Halobaculum sp. EA56 TaxID=3421648 RepID=UPI003EC0162F
MTGSGTATAPTVSRRRRYRLLMAGTLLGGVAAGLALRSLDYHVAGEAVYWLGVLGFLAVWRFSPVTLFDERDEALERHASALTLGVFAVILPVGASAARLATRLGRYDVPELVWGALYGYVGLFVVFALAYGWLRRTR